MERLKGTKREITLKQWNEVLADAEKRLADSQKCLELFGGESDKRLYDQDKMRVAEIKKQIEEVIKYMDEHNIE